MNPYYHTLQMNYCGSRKYRKYFALQQLELGARRCRERLGKHMYGTDSWFFSAREKSQPFRRLEAVLETFLHKQVRRRIGNSIRCAVQRCDAMQCASSYDLVLSKSFIRDIHPASTKKKKPSRYLRPHLESRS